MDPIEVLRRARDIITNTANWAQGALYRRGPNGNVYCVVGAIRVVQSRSCDGDSRPNGDEKQAIAMLDGACKRLFGDGPITESCHIDQVGGLSVRVNDKMGHSSIMLALDTVINDYADHAIHEPSHEERLQGQKVSERRDNSPLPLALLTGPPMLDPASLV